MSTSNLLEITQAKLNAIFGTGDTEITVTGKQYITKYGMSGTTYDGFEIKEHITIRKNKILKDFENIQTKYNISNNGKIDGCTIILNGNNSDLYNSLNNYGEINNCTIILNDKTSKTRQFINDGKINKCTITLNTKSEIWNGFDKNSEINNCTITLNIDSIINNGYKGVGNIYDCIITLNNDSSIHNGKESTSIEKEKIGKMNKCTIYLNKNSKFYNNGEKISEVNGCIIILRNYSFINNGNSSSKCESFSINNSFIFMHDNTVFNSYRSKASSIITHNYFFVFDKSKILITDKTIVINNLIMIFSNNCVIEVSSDKNNVLTTLTTSHYDDLDTKISQLKSETTGTGETSLVTRISNLETKTDNLDVSEINSLIEGLSNSIDKLIEKIKILFSDDSILTSFVNNSSSNSIQKLLLLSMLNSNNSGEINNINRLFK